MKILYIYDAPDCITLTGDDTIYSYCLNAGSVCAPHNNHLNDSDRLNDIALSLRDEYSAFIYSLNQKCITHDLFFENNLSLYCISDLSNKRTELFDTYATICHLVLLQEKVRDIQIDKIITHGCSHYFIEALQSIFSDTDIESTKSTARERYSFFRNYIVSCWFFINICIKRIWLLIMGYRNNKSGSIGNLFFTICPLHLNERGFDQKYGALVKNNDGYLVSIMTDGMHQWQSLWEYMKDIRMLKKMQSVRKIILLDREITLRDSLVGYLKAIQLQKKKKKLKNDMFIFNNINITKFIQYEIDISFKRIPRLLIYAHALRKIFHTFEVGNFYYYLHEYSFGRFLTYMLARHFPEVKKIGFQHGPASRRKLLYALAQNECALDRDYVNHVPIPDAILCEDTLSKKIYERAGYRSIDVMKEIPRLYYLNDIKRDAVRKDTVLVACGLHDGPAIFVVLKDEIINNKHKKYFIKFHPKTPHRKIIRDIQSSHIHNLEVAQRHVAYYLSFVDEVISSYSSVGYEAYLLGIKTRVLKLNNKINESPLLDMVQDDKK